jgi:glucose-6-phosphate 1-dehydrogenase
MLGDATLFNRADAVDLSWELVDPILDRWKEDGSTGLAHYAAGSWGPQEADDLIERDGRQWRRL